MAGNQPKFGLERYPDPQSAKDAPTTPILTSFPALIRLFAPLPTQTNPFSDLSHRLETHEFQLGDELFVYRPSDYFNQKHPGLNAESNAELYLICSGRVRVLCKDAIQSREVTASVLEIGETFGADHLFRDTLSSYRVIAASPCQIARISAAKLVHLLNQLPQLCNRLMMQVQRREYLIFFKTLTQLKSLPHRQLQQYVLSQLVEQPVSAGVSLRLAVSEDTGYFWLRSGRIISPENTLPPPEIGDCWSYPEPIPSDWVAQTDLLLYKRPLDSWVTARLRSLL